LACARRKACGSTSSPFAPFVLDGPINAECFLAYVEQILLPVLRQGDTVILDNLSSRKNEEAARLIAGAGARLLFLPPYSPDLNPIEMAFAKLKERLRQAQARTLDTLWISSDAPWTCSSLKNAPTTSVIADTIRFARNRL
jgi:transposase